MTSPCSVNDKEVLNSVAPTACQYWAVQAGLLTPLTFSQHRLSPLVLLLPVLTFFTMAGGDSEFANFSLPTLKAFLEAGSHNVSGNSNNLFFVL